MKIVRCSTTIKYRGGGPRSLKVDEGTGNRGAGPQNYEVDMESEGAEGGGPRGFKGFIEGYSRGYCLV